jgi:NDP-sugar pyrophosphorylase family protein
LPAHRDYPHRIEFSVAKDCSNTFSAVKNVLKEVKVPHSGYLLLHADTINSVSLQEVLSYHQTKNSDLTLLVKAKRELGELEKKLPEG